MCKLQQCQAQVVAAAERFIDTKLCAEVPTGTDSLQEMQQLL